MLTLLLILIIIACILLVVVILAQNPKGGGGLSNLGAGASQFLGARQTADFLEKSTWYFGIGILAIVMMTYFLTTTPETEGGTKFKTEGVDYSLPVGPSQNPAPANNAPAGNTLPQPEPAQK